MTESAKGHLAMFLFSALVAGSFSLGGMVANLIDPLALNIVRFLIAAFVVGVFTVATQGIDRSSINAPWRYLILGGVFAVYFVLMFEGLKTAAPVSASAVFTLTPVLAAVAGWFILRQVTTKRMMIALSIGAFGALWVIFRADWHAFTALKIGQGEVVYFYGCVAHAIYIPLVRVLNRGESALVFTFWTLLAGAALMTLWGGGVLLQTDWLNLPPIVWIAIAYISIGATAVTFVLVQFSSLRLPSAKVMAYTYLTPTWVIMWEFALGHGVPTAWVLGGIVFTIIALSLLLRDEHQPVGNKSAKA